MGGVNKHCACTVGTWYKINSDSDRESSDYDAYSYTATFKFKVIELPKTTNNYSTTQRKYGISKKLVL